MKMKKALLLQLLLLLSAMSSAQQIADTLYNPPLQNPAYPEGQGSVVLIDEAHDNFHTLQGRFKPFALLLQRDGYVVRALSQTFTQQTLSQGKIIVIANALHPDNQERWSLPTPSAFTDQEILAINEWVKGGGSLFLIADHMPFPGAAEKLAASFGVKFYNGFAMKKRKKGKDIFTPGKGLQECSLTQGRSDIEKITSLQTFTGQAFQVPETALPVIVLDEDYQLLMPQTAWEFDRETSTVPAASFVQGAYMPYGEGRVVVFGEAAMFTAQQQGRSNKVGMNMPSAAQNAQFLLNTIHWLDHVID
jgi:hypothetical protein